jgi:hypothetical protein
MSYRKITDTICFRNIYCTPMKSAVNRNDIVAADLKPPAIGGYYYDDSPGKFHRRNEENILVRFGIEHAYQVFNFLESYWGDFNACPNCRTMKEKAREWHDRYGAELIRISHDTLTFQCRGLSTEEAEEIIEEAYRLRMRQNGRGRNL